MKLDWTTQFIKAALGFYPAQVWEHPIRRTPAGLRDHGLVDHRNKNFILSCDHSHAVDWNDGFPIECPNLIRSWIHLDWYDRLRMLICDQRRWFDLHHKTFPNDRIKDTVTVTTTIEVSPGHYVDETSSASVIKEIKNNTIISNKESLPQRKTSHTHKCVRTDFRGKFPWEWQ